MSAPLDGRQTGAQRIRRCAVGIVCTVMLAASSALAQHQEYQGGPPARDLATFSGLADAPEADLFFGSSRTSIPIEVPAGRKQMTPRLSLTYSSSAGPSPYGYGWTLPLGRVQRSSRGGVLTCANLGYVEDFVLVLPEQSVEFTRDASGRGTPRVQETFLKIQHNASQNSWTVWDRSGIKYRFGESAHARTGTDPNVLYGSTSCNPSGTYGPAYTFAWELTSVEDPNGNRVEMQYTPGFNLSDGVAYPERVLYGGHSNGFAHQFEVNFIWANERPDGDEIVNGIGGFPARLTRYLSDIVVRRAPGGAVIRRYGLAYELDVDVPRLGRQTFLSAVTLFDGNNQALARHDGLPASGTFLYREPDTSELGFAPVQLAAKPSGSSMDFGRRSDNSSTSCSRDVFDITGDGLVDWVVPSTSGCASTWMVYPGTLAGFSTTAIQWQSLGCQIREGRSVGDSPRHTYTDKDTIDLNGDTIPDFIDTTTWSSANQWWRVHLGYVTANGGGFLTTPTNWPAPRKELRHTISADVSAPALGYSPAPGSIDLRDVIDMNGDGLLDLVDVEGASAGMWPVWLNTGSGFATTARNFAVGLPGVTILRWTRERDEIIGIRDMNADGLPDQVFAGYGNVTWPGYWYVFLNSGHAMDVVEQWAIPSAVGGRYLRRMDSSQEDVTREVMDVNGDGLPDLVDQQGWTTQNPYWRVVLNRGGGFSASVLSWYSPAADIRSGGDEKTYQDTFDIDGDGLVDYVDFTTPGSLPIYRHLGGAWCASSDGSTCSTQPNATTAAARVESPRTDLLVALENGIGGSTQLEYRPSSQWDNTGGDGINDLPFALWTVTRIERDDGLCNDAGGGCLSSGAHTLVTNVAYQNGRFDPASRQLRGFQIVTSRDADGTTPPVQGKTTYFHQGAALVGKISDLWVFDAANGGQFFGPLTRTISTWQCANPTTGAAITCPSQPNGNVWVRLVRTDDFAFNSFQLNSSKRASHEVHAWSQCGGKFYGQIAHYSNGDAGGTPRVHHHAEYACTDTTSAYITDRPMHTWVNATNDTTRLREEWFFYDWSSHGVITKGDLTRREQWLDQWTGPTAPCSVSTKSCASTQMVYDVYGNIVSIYDALNRQTTTQYDSTQIYPSIVTSPAPLSHKVATAYDPACSALLWRTIPYTGTTIPAIRGEKQYDSFCRLRASFQPGDSPSGIPHEAYSYALGSPQKAGRVSVSAREPSAAAGIISTHVLTDALGRTVQQQQLRAVAGSAAHVATLTTEFDARGNARINYAPFTISNPANYNQPAASVGRTQTDVDALNRPTRVTNPDNSVREIEHSLAWQTTTRDECFTASSCVGGQAVEIRDALGRVTDRKLYDETNLRSRIAYTYDELGRMLTSRQGISETTLNEATRITLTYDTLGRKIQMSDPDSGVWRYGYDVVGNLRFQDDPKTGQHLQFCYDALDRVTLECPLAGDYASSLLNCSSPACTGADAVRSFYDSTAVPFGFGRLTRVTDGSGETTFDQYDARGRLLQTTKEIDALGDGANVTSAVTAFEYDSADHLTRLTYPDGEQVEYQYDATGQVKRLRSLTHQVDYVSNITYDVFGRATATTHGNGTIDVRTFGGAATNYRLSLLATHAGSALRLSYAYQSYLPTGRISQITDNGPKGSGSVMDNSATFSYDGIGRLSQASGPQLGTLSYQYDYLGNIIAKDGLTFTYSTSKPHTLTRINGSTNGIAHDANGNRSGKPSHAYTYDHRDRLSEINAGQTRFRYDYTGRKVAKITNGSPVTVYYSELAESAGGWLTKNYYIGDVLVAARRGQAAGFAALPSEGVRLAAISLEHPMLTFVLSRDVRTAFVASITLLTIGLLCFPGRRKRVVGIRLHKGQVLIVAGAVACTTCPWPWAVRSAEALCFPPAAVLYHFHPDHLGSTQLITDSAGGVIQYVRYRPYGEIRGRYDGNGSSIAPNQIHRREFTGYESDFGSGLQYAGARFYDPALGTFLSHDPARQFANPYAYGSWNPLNGTDSNGGWFLEFVFAVVIAAAISAAINTIVAAAQGASLSQIGRAAIRGAITGAIGVGLGVVSSGLSIGAAALGGTLPAGVGVQEALNALSEVAFRSAISTTLSNAAGQAAAAAGAPSGLVTGISVVAGYVGSVGYDQLWLDPAGSLAQLEGPGAQLASNSTAHTNITTAAAEEAGFSRMETEIILSGNLVQDADVWNNQSHFGAGAQQAAHDFSGKAAHALANGNRFDYLSSLGAVTHYIQDQYALGHIFPGTHLLSGPIGAPFRGLIHQTIGGEVNFFSMIGNARVPSSFSATRSFLAGANLTGA